MCLLCIFILIPNAEGAVTKYTTSSTIVNKSQLAQFIFENKSEIAKYYEKYNKIHVFANDQHSAAFMMKISREVFDRIAEDLGLESIKKDSLPFSIFVLSESTWQALNLNQGAVAFYMEGHNEIYVRLASIDQEVLASNLAHELTHLVVDGINKAVPLWFNEGIAQYESDKVLGLNKRKKNGFLEKSEIVDVLKNNTVTIKDVIDSKQYMNNKYLFYELSYQIIRYIDHAGSLSRFSRAYLISNTSFLSALKQSISFQITSIDHFEKEIIKYLS